MATFLTARVLFVDPSPLLYQGICQALDSNQTPQIEWARDSQSALTNEKQFDLVLIGHSFDARQALEFCRQLHAQSIETKIILINMNADNALFQEDAFVAGASACLAPSIPPQELRAILEQVSCGAKLFEEWILSGVFQTEPLTKREVEILAHIAEDKTDKEIASGLHISVNTVRNHVQNILNKLQAKDRDVAVWRAKHQGWIRNKEQI